MLFEDTLHLVTKTEYEKYNTPSILSQLYSINMAREILYYEYRAWKYSWLTSRGLFLGSLHASKHSDVNNTPPVMIKLNQNKQNDKI